MNRIRFQIILISLIFVSLFMMNSNIFSQTKRVWFNPGIKLGYQFGNSGGFVIGFEATVVWEKSDRADGIIIDLDYCKSANYLKLNLGIESHPFPFRRSPFGLSFGPSVIFQDSVKRFGITAITYSGLFLIPFFGATFTLDLPPTFETGSYLKIPIIVSGPRIRGVGG